MREDAFLNCTIVFHGVIYFYFLSIFALLERQLSTIKFCFWEALFPASQTLFRYVTRVLWLVCAILVPEGSRVFFMGRAETSHVVFWLPCHPCDILLPCFSCLTRCCKSSPPSHRFYRLVQEFATCTQTLYWYWLNRTVLQWTESIDLNCVCEDWVKGNRIINWFIRIIWNELFGVSHSKWAIRIEL